MSDIRIHHLPTSDCIGVDAILDTFRVGDRCAMVEVGLTTHASGSRHTTIDTVRDDEVFRLERVYYSGGQSRVSFMYWDGANWYQLDDDAIAAAFKAWKKVSEDAAR